MAATTASRVEKFKIDASIRLLAGQECYVFVNDHPTLYELLRFPPVCVQALSIPTSFGPSCLTSFFSTPSLALPSSSFSDTPKISINGPHPSTTSPPSSLLFLSVPLVIVGHRCFLEQCTKLLSSLFSVSTQHAWKVLQHATIVGYNLYSTKEKNYWSWWCAHVRVCMPIGRVHKGKAVLFCLIFCKA